MEQAKEIGARPAAMLAEPAVRDTAPAIALIAHYAKAHLPEGALALVLPSDHLIPDAKAFQTMVESAAPLALAGNLITFGIAPTFPATGYGYIQAGEAMGPGRKVKRFVEKPDEETAASYLKEGSYAWNAGIFLFSPATLLATLAAH